MTPPVIPITDATAAQTDAVLRAATHVRVATSFGGAHSTWERRARWPGETVPASLVRLSVGLEPLETLRIDVLRALDA